MHLLRRSPIIGAAAITAAFFLLVLVVLRPGYWINDDLKIIWNIVGYPGTPSPTNFMIHGNVLLGMPLASLYALPTTVNWYELLLSLANACGMGAYLYIVLSSSLPRVYRVAGVVVILAVHAILILNITYTVTAALAASAGTCLILTASHSRQSGHRGRAWSGIALIVMASLIRIQMLLPVLALSIAVFLALRAQWNWRRVLTAAVAAGVLVAGGQFVDMLYVRANPDWQAYYTYNVVREQLHDSHRLSNIHNQIRRVGWTANDQELFARWFYPDQSLYSLDHIQYLVDHTPSASQDPVGVLVTFLRRIVSPPWLFYLMGMLGMLIWAIVERPWKPMIWSTLLIGAAAIGSNAALSWFYKDPDYVLASGLAGSTAFVVVCFAMGGNGDAKQPVSWAAASPWRRAARAASALLMAGSVALLLGQLPAASRTNVGKQAAYAGMLRDLNELQAAGKLSPRALIIAPAHGLPFEWSNPFVLSRPAVSYFDTGWLTFSPTYFRVLREFGIDSLPKALYEKDGLYLMCEETFTPFLARYYEEHVGVSVRFEPIYAMPNPNHLAGYDGNYLYKVSLAP